MAKALDKPATSPAGRPDLPTPPPDKYCASEDEDGGGGNALAADGWVASQVAVSTAMAAEPTTVRDWRGWLSRHRQLGFDAGAVLVASLDVALAPPDAPTYSYVLSGLSCLFLIGRRRFPRAVLLLCLPGLLVSYSVIAALVALYTVARSRPLGWQTMVGGVLVFAGYFVIWPLHEFFADMSVRDLGWRFIRSTLVTAAPIALGLLVETRRQLSARLDELAAGREREQRLREQAVRAEERARLARDMHDVVSHQISLIAMQAGALQMSTTDIDLQRVASTIRQLSTRTLDELRHLVGVLRTTVIDYEDGAHPGVDQVPELVAGCGVPVVLSMGQLPDELHPTVSAAAYRTIQEALTNASKHAPGSQADVLVQALDQRLLVSVSNGPPRDAEYPVLPGGGHGLVGLRERAGLLGGTLEVGPTVDGGFLVRAIFPLSPATDHQ